MATDIESPILDAENAEKDPSNTPPQASLLCETPTNAPVVFEDVATWHWHVGEIIASFLAFNAASRQKQTSTRAYRAKFAAGCYMKFTKKMKAEGKWDSKVDIGKSRDVLFKWVQSGKNAGESSAYRKVAQVKREILNVILPIYIH